MVRFYTKDKELIAPERVMQLITKQPIDFVALHRKGVTKGIIEPDKVILLREKTELDGALYPQVVLRNTDKDINHRVLLLNLGFEIEETLNTLMQGLNVAPIKERNYNFVAYDFSKILSEPIV